MTTFINSLRRLYLKGDVTDEKLDSLEIAGKITADEKAYIKEGGGPSPDPDLEGLRTFHSEVMGMVGGGENA